MGQIMFGWVNGKMKTKLTYEQSHFQKLQFYLAMQNILSLIKGCH